MAERQLPNARRSRSPGKTEHLRNVPSEVADRIPPKSGERPNNAERGEEAGLRRGRIMTWNTCCRTLLSSTRRRPTRQSRPLGSTVSVKTDSKELTYTIVGPAEARPNEADRQRVARGPCPPRQARRRPGPVRCPRHPQDHRHRHQLATGSTQREQAIGPRPCCLLLVTCCVS
jgi:hypothetical protein